MDDPPDIQSPPVSPEGVSDVFYSCSQLGLLERVMEEAAGDTGQATQASHPPKTAGPPGEAPGHG